MKINQKNGMMQCHVMPRYYNAEVGDIKIDHVLIQAFQYFTEKL